MQPACGPESKGLSAHRSLTFLLSTATHMADNLLSAPGCLWCRFGSSCWRTVSMFFNSFSYFSLCSRLPVVEIREQLVAHDICVL